VLVTGGSQGATILSSVVPAGLALLPEHFRRRLQVTQQCGPRTSRSARQICQARHPGRSCHLPPRLPDRLAWSHLVIARAGASTIAELTAAGARDPDPAADATDNHQVSNAREMAKAGGRAHDPAEELHAGRARQADAEARLEPDALAAPRARQAVGRPDATKDLANLIERIGAIPPRSCRREQVAFRPLPQGAYA
jgi:UDP-N-acetylglucosamine--N-acetylmuramyl-(pentapeptide) pyrophosphoryl-undecaprenol N-acetylglucosamine transferase